MNTFILYGEGTNIQKGQLKLSVAKSAQALYNLLSRYAFDTKIGSVKLQNGCFEPKYVALLAVYFH
jgi:hypothetical protein